MKPDEGIAFHATIARLRTMVDRGVRLELDLGEDTTAAKALIDLQGESLIVLIKKEI